MLALFLLPVVSFIAFVGIYHIRMKGDRASPETAACNLLLRIYKAQVEFKNQAGRYASIKELTAQGYIREEVSQKPINRYYHTINGYYYEESVQPTADAFCVLAMREDYSAGTKDFNIDEAGVLRFTTSRDQAGCGKGTPVAGAEDPAPTTTPQ